MKKHSTIDGIVFDMDGVLIDSEPFWCQAEAEILNQVGVPMTAQDGYLTTGLRIDKVVDFWHQRHPWRTESPNSLGEVTNRIVSRVCELVREGGTALPGALEALAAAAAAFPKAVAIATSSPTQLVAAVMDRLSLHKYINHVASAEHLKHPKPHPEVYLVACAAIDVAPQAALAIEDSVLGVVSAKAASMTVLAVPAAHDFRDRRFGIADTVLPSLNYFPTFLHDLLNK